MRVGRRGWGGKGKEEEEEGRVGGGVWVGGGVVVIPPEDTIQESPAQDPSMSVCCRLTVYNLPRHLLS